MDWVRAADALLGLMAKLYLPGLGFAGLVLWLYLSQIGQRELLGRALAQPAILSSLLFAALLLAAAISFIVIAGTLAPSLFLSDKETRDAIVDLTWSRLFFTLLAALSLPAIVLSAFAIWLPGSSWPATALVAASVLAAALASHCTFKPGRTVGDILRVAVGIFMACIAVAMVAAVLPAGARIPAQEPLAQFLLLSAAAVAVALLAAGWCSLSIASAPRPPLVRNRHSGAACLVLLTALLVMVTLVAWHERLVIRATDLIGIRDPELRWYAVTDKRIAPELVGGDWLGSAVDAETTQVRAHRSLIAGDFFVLCPATIDPRRVEPWHPDEAARCVILENNSLRKLPRI
jgi:hypothetical protein